MTIRALDDETIRQIAAGEVIERPASVVKELVENSLDAGADRIDVSVDDGGKAGIRVSDNGRGMSPEAVRLAVKKHTTSKIESLGDLSDLGTLGFRGEALHAIGAVSTLTITTRAVDHERGTELRVSEGAIEAVQPAGRAPGTTVEVTDLFASMPAREKFLKADATEFDHVNRIVTRYALANPDVALSLTHNGREVFSTDGRGDLQAALLDVYGREVASSMIPVDHEGVTGYVSHPETTRSTREYVSTYVNGRYVKSSLLRGAVVDAYSRQLAADRYPFAVVFIDLPGDAVDVNVHPRKLEVRFDDEGAVRERVYRAVEEALLDHGLVRSGAPRGRSAPDDAAVRPEPDPPTATEDLIEDAEPETLATSGGTDDPAASTSDTWEWAERRFHDQGTQTTLDAEPVDEATPFEQLPAIRVLGQLRDTYVVGAADDGLVLIDQHAADERVNYERLRAELDGSDSQALAEPVVLELTAREAALFPSFQAALERMGFRAAEIADRVVEVSAVPAVLDETLDPSLLRDVLSEFVAERSDSSVDEHADALLADLACYPSITGHTSLTEGSIQRLLEALDGCENPYACPHGRPTVIEIDAAEIDNRFERDYPGHAHRRRE